MARTPRAEFSARSMAARPGTRFYSKMRIRERLMLLSTLKTPTFYLPRSGNLAARHGRFPAEARAAVFIARTIAATPGKNLMSMAFLRDQMVALAWRSAQIPIAFTL